MTVQDPNPTDLEAAVEQMLAGRLRDPHEVLGPRTLGEVMRIRAFHPEATRASVARPDGVTAMRRLNAAGLFEATVPAGEPPVLLLRHFEDWGERWLDSDPESRTRSPPAVKVPGGAFQDIFDAWASSPTIPPWSEPRSPSSAASGTRCVPTRTHAGCSTLLPPRRSAATSRSAAPRT